MTENSDKWLKLATERTGSAVVVRITGGVGIIEADALRRKLEDLASEQVPLIVLDLSEMDFVCSGGLGAIVSGHVKSRYHEGKLRLVNPQPPVRQMLETTRLTKLFPLYETVEQALEQ